MSDSVKRPLIKLATAIASLSLPAIVGAIIFVTAGHCKLPFVWAVLGALSLFSIALVYFSDPGLVRERHSPGPGNRDRLTRPVTLLLFISHWSVVGMDVGRFRWSVVPWGIQVAGLVVYVAVMGVLLWAMCVNPFYSSVVRVQSERGHYPISVGPYRYVRHPGYAASMIAFLSGGVALGSWLAMLPLLIVVVLFIRRTLLEDRLLQQELPGYAEYAQKVRYRLIVGLF